MSSVLERFLRYVTYDTQSEERSTAYPSTEKQLVLLRDLAAELRDIGVSDAAVDEFGYVFATIPPTTRKQVPAIGFIAHAVPGGIGVPGVEGLNSCSAIG